MNTKPEVFRCECGSIEHALCVYPSFDEDGSRDIVLLVSNITPFYKKLWQCFTNQNIVLGDISLSNDDVKRMKDIL